MTKRVLLVGPSKTTSHTANWGAPPLGIHRLAAWLRRKIKAIEVEVYDPCKDGMPDKQFFADRDLIGFSPLSETLASDLGLMNLAHAASPVAEIVVGGVEATLNHQDILDKSPATWIVLGNGERQLEAIVNGVPAEQIDGIIYRRYGRHISGDELWDFYQELDFSKMAYEEYWAATASMYLNPDWQDVRTVRLVTSTHCNRRCTFCSVAQWHRAAVGSVVPAAMLSAEQMLALVGKVKREVPLTETVYFCEDDVCQSRDRIDRFCEESASLGVTYLMQTHSARVTESLVQTLKRGGVRHLTLGIENASDKVLRSFQKPQKLERMPEIIRWCEEAKIVPYLLFILFAPEASIEDLKINCRALEEWHGMGARISIEPYTMPYRGAPLYESLHEFGWSRVEVNATGIALKQPTVILPDDPHVRDIMVEFDRRWPAYKQAHAASHSYKGMTGLLMVRLLASILDNPPPHRPESAARVWQQVTSDRNREEASVELIQ